MLEIGVKKICVLLSLPLFLSRNDRRNFLFSMYKMQVSFGQPVRVLSAQPGCQQSFQSTNPWGFHSPSPLQPPQASPQDTCVQALAEQHSRFGAVPVPAVLPRGLPSPGSPERADASVGARPWQTCCSSQHCLCEHLQVLGRVLLCYTSCCVTHPFSAGYQLFTLSTPMCSEPVSGNSLLLSPCCRPLVFK